MSVVESGELVGSQGLKSTSVVVYLNESRNGLLGFCRRTARLRKAAEFVTDADLAWHDPRVDGRLVSCQELSACFDDQELRERRFAETVFEQLNIGGEPGVDAAEYTVAYRAAGNRSLSVGDVVEIGGHCYAVGRFSWDREMSLAVRMACRRFERLGAEASF